VRIYNWQAALDHIRLSPWIGTGSGTHLIYGRLFRRPPIQVDPVHAHCDYLELIAEYGIAGAACMALFLTAHIRKALRTFSAILRQRFIPSGLHRSNRFALQFGALCAVVGLAIHSVVDFDMHIPGNALVFAFLFGMLANPEIQDPPAVVDRRVTPWIKLLLPALGLFMLWRGMPMLPSEYCSEIARRALRNHNFLDSIAYAKKGIGPGTTPPPSPAADADPADEPELLDKLLAKAGPNPRNPDLYFYLGEANRGLAMRMGNLYLRQNYYGRAATAFEAGLKLFPEDESMLIRYGQVLDGLHRFPDAEVVYQKALTWDPKLDTLHEYYESHLAAEGKKAEAAALARERQESRPNEVDAGPKGDFRLQ